jgi:hygromycin-B 4-O-kinase
VSSPPTIRAAADPGGDAELEGHWEQHGGLPPRLHHRLRAYLVHIGLDAMAYNAHHGRWDDLARTASQISELT